MSDDEPPSKISKRDDLKKIERFSISHEDTLNRYGIKNLEATACFHEVPNDLIVSLIFFKTSHLDMLHITRKMLGLAEEGRDHYDRFRRAVSKIDAESKKKRKRGKDEYLKFLKNAAFTKEFFYSDCIVENNFADVGNSEQGSEETCTESSVIDKAHHQYCQTDLSCYIDLKSPAKTTSSIKKLHESCLVQYDTVVEKCRKHARVNETLKNWRNYNKKLLLNTRNFRKSLNKLSFSNKKLHQLLGQKNQILATLKKSLRDKDDLLQALLAKIDNVQSGKVQLKEGKSYSNETFKAVVNLKLLGVADEKVGKVIEIVGELAGVSFDSVPSASSVRNFALASLRLGQIHVKHKLDDFLEDEKSLCLASDETTKGTAKLQAFGVHAPDGTFLCVGIEPVAEKSAQTAFDVLEETVSGLPEASADFFKKVLVSVSCTMSDAARTETKFNELVSTSRSKAIPEIVSDYAKLTEPEKEKFHQFSQFFCQLHILANYTSVVLKSMLEHELVVRGLSKLEEPSVFVLIKSVSQLFGQRGSGLHGILQIWTAWCTRYHVNRYSFPAFVGNRFNILFVIASRIFFHRHHLLEFIKECEESKPALRDIKDLLENEMVTEHLHVLGLCDQLITGPLWRLSEGCDHILNTCSYSLQLQKWLETCSVSPVSFFDGTSPTTSLEVESPTNSLLLLRALVNRSPTKMSGEVVSLVCKASLEYFNRAFVDFLPGGKHCDDDNNIRETTECAPATNRNIESVFGMMSHFYDTKPNMRVDVRIAMTILKKNHTFSWLQTLPEQIQDEILKESRASLNNLRNVANSRQLEIETVILQQMKEKNQAAAKKQAKFERDCHKSSQEIIKLGYWQTHTDIKTGLAKCATEKDKRESILSQIRFRKLIIKQEPPSPKIFAASANSKPLPLTQLIANLQLLMEKSIAIRQLLLVHHQFIGKKFIDYRATRARKDSSKRGTVVDIRLSGSKKVITLQYTDENDQTKLDFVYFTESLDSKSIVFVED